jgi:hypothetical protein
MERLLWVAEDHNRLVYHLPKPMPDGRSQLYLTPLELLDRLAQLIPPPRLHRHRYHGAFAPNSPLRPQVTALVKDSDGVPDTLSGVPVINELSETRRPQPAYLWAILMARIYEIFPLECPTCGHPMRIIAFVTEPEPVRKFLNHVGEPTQPPEIAPARGPPQWDEADINQDIYEYNFDQSISW